MFEINKEMKEIISFFKIKENYWDCDIDKVYKEHDITQDIYNYRKFMDDFMLGNSISVNHTFKYIKESIFLNNFINNQSMSIYELISYDFDIAYFIASRKTDDVVQKRELLKKSLMCKNGEILVPESFLDIIKLNKETFQSDKSVNNYIQALKYLGMSSLVYCSDTYSDDFDEITQVLRPEMQSSSDLVFNESVLNYIHIFRCLDVEYFNELAETTDIKEALSKIVYDLPEKFVNMTIREEIKKHIRMPFINVFK